MVRLCSKRARFSFWAIVVGVWCAPARGLVGVSVMPSVEYAVGESDVVVRGLVVQISEARGDVARRVMGRLDVRIEVLEAMRMRGPVARPRIVVDADRGRWRGRVGDEVLVCVREPPGLAIDGAGFELGEALYELRGPWWMWVLSGGEMGWAVSMNLRRIESPSELLHIVREAVGYGPPRADGKSPPVMELASPAQTPPGFLTVCMPLDGRMERIARRWALSDDPVLRERAAVVLGARGLEWTWDALKPLLNDPYSRVHTVSHWTASLEGRATRNFPVRDAARRALAGPFSPIVDSDVPEMRYRPVSFGGTALYLVGVIGLAGMASRRGVRLRGWVCVLCAGLAGLVLLGWWRSWVVVDSVSVAAGGVDWEITATMGEVVVLRVEDGAAAHGPMVWTERVDPSQRLWYSGALTGTDRIGWWSPKVFGGRIWGVQTAYPFVAVVVPYWAVLGVVPAWPAAWLAMRVAGWVMRLRRIRAGRCGECGYDLRGSVGARCNECGAVGTLIVGRDRNARSGLRPESDAAGVGVGDVGSAARG